MERFRTAILWSLWPAVLVGVGLIAGNSATGQDPGDGAANEAGLTELTRGPIHEAFAEPVIFNPKPGIVVKKEPPKPIEELPPEQKPEGENVAFIAGYFSFDEDKDDFIYISGIWRLIPPGKEWVGGYWNQVDGGWQWVSGHWKSLSEVVAAAPVNEGGPAKTEVEYYPEPPPSLENGANVEAPTADHVWVPGCHVWYTNRYVWRGGYWVVARPDWMWVPAHYMWTPCGYVFVDGYWDYAIARRGVIFAPCYFDAVVYARPRFVYCPRLVIDVGIVTDHFFCRPAYQHYYFGDYYATSYVSIGISPWFSFHYGHGHYCPIYSHYRWSYARHDTRWEVDLRSNYRHRVEHVDYRPARTYVQQTTIINNITVNKNVNVTNVNPKQLALAKPLTQVAKQPVDPKAGNAMKFEKVAQADRQAFASKAADVRRVSTERGTLETKTAKDLKAAGGMGPGNTGVAKPVTLNLPKSTVASKPVEQLKTNAPPPVPAGGIIRPKKTGDTAGKPGTGGTTGPVVGGSGKPGDTTKPGGSGAGGTGAGTAGKPGDPTKPSGSGGTGAGTAGKPGDPTKPSGSGAGGTGAGSAGKPGDPNKPSGSGAGGTGTGTAGKPGDPTKPSGSGAGGSGSGGTKPPMGGGSTPPTGGASTPPIGGSKPPTSGGSTPPSGGGSLTPPSGGGSKPPTSGGTPPSGGSKPPMGGSSNLPTGGGSKPPASGGSSGSGTKPSGSGGSSGSSTKTKDSDSKPGGKKP
jgi:hypothetical protein